MFTDAGISPLGVLITSGIAETWEELAEAEALVRELQDFRVEFTPVGHLTFNARSGKHDDLVLVLAIAVWRARRQLSRMDAIADNGRGGERAATSSGSVSGSRGTPLPSR